MSYALEKALPGPSPLTVFLQNRNLLDAFRRGDRETLAAVYHEYVDGVAKLVARGIRERDRQHDLVQEVFLRAFSEAARRSYDGISPYRPFLLRIARNLMIDEARKAGRAVEPLEVLDEDPGTNGAPDSSPEDDLEWRTLREATVAYCATLSETLQRFVKLRFEDESSQRDIAEALQVTRRKVRTWEKEVHDGLRRHLRQVRLRPETASKDSAPHRVREGLPVRRPGTGGGS